MSPIWGASATTNLIDSLQVAQNRALRSIFGNDYYALNLNTNQIRAKHNILNVKQIVKYDTNLLAYKVKHKMIKNEIFTQYNADRHHYGTRRAHDFYQQSFRSNAGRFSVSRQIAISHNSLPHYIKNAQSFNLFKKHLKIHILSVL